MTKKYFLQCWKIILVNPKEMKLDYYIFCEAERNEAV